MGLFREGAVEPREQFLTDDELDDRWAPHAVKRLLFKKAGYQPHYYQELFHTSRQRYRVCSAGRRGGKSKGGAMEFAVLCDPRPIRLRDTDGNVYETTVQRNELSLYGVDLPGGNQPIVNIIFTPDTKNYPATKRLFEEAMDSLGVIYTYNENKQTWFIPSKENPKCIVYWRGTDKPRSARGEGYCAGWGDEPAFIVGPAYIDSLRPAFSDRRGIFLFTTTPSDEVDNWWFHDYYIDPTKAIAKRVAYFEWTSVDNPYFDEEEYLEALEQMHWLLFSREYLARWDKGGGKILKSDWVHFYDPETDMHQKPDGSGVDWSRYQLFAGVDPAAQLKNHNDYFVAVVIAWDRESGEGFLVDLYRDKIEFPDQIELLKQLRKDWPGLLRIGVESVGYQAVLSQQARAEKVDGIFEIKPGRSHKDDRILQLGTVFKRKKVRVPRDKKFTPFLTEWEQFPNSDHDDTLDGTDIAIRATGSLLPQLMTGLFRADNQGDQTKLLDRMDPDADIDNERRDIYDQEMGADW